MRVLESVARILRQMIRGKKPPGQELGNFLRDKTRKAITSLLNMGGKLVDDIVLERLHEHVGRMHASGSRNAALGHDWRKHLKGRLNETKDDHTWETLMRWNMGGRQLMSTMLRMRKEK